MLQSLARLRGLCPTLAASSDRAVLSSLSSLSSSKEAITTHSSCLCSPSALRSVSSSSAPQASGPDAAPEASTSGSSAPGGHADLVAKYLSLRNMNHKTAHKAAVEGIMAQFQRHEGDVGSPEVQVAVWTHWMREQAKHFHVHRKNFHAMRQFEQVFHKRRRLLAWMRSAQPEAYSQCISQLGLSDVFTAASDYARYREGVPQALKEGGDPTLRVLAYAYQRRHYTKKTSQWKRLLPKLQYEDPLLPKAPESGISASSSQQRTSSKAGAS